MRVLITYKSSKYSRLSQANQTNLDKLTLSQMQLAHQEHEDSLKALRLCLTSAKVSFKEILRGQDFNPSLYDLVLSVGGDGTFLAASHQILESSVLLIGLKSSATSVGKLCFGAVAEFAKILPELKKKYASMGQPLHRFAVRSGQGEQPAFQSVPVANDVLFCHADPAETSRYAIFIDGQRIEEHKSSGLWIATAAGSTAAIHTMGGRSMPLSSGYLQLKVRELYAPPARLALCEHEFLDPLTQQLRIVNLSPQAILAVDGSSNQYRLELGSSFEVVPGPDLRMLI